MRKPKTHYATRGWLTSEGASKSEAKAKLETMIDWACDHAAPVVECRFGLLLFVAAAPAGWQHSIIDPADIRRGDKKLSSVCHGQIEYSEALDCARSHAAQWAWTPAVDDALFIDAAGLSPQRAADLVRWIQFQRNYQYAKDLIVDIASADTGILERMSVPLPEALGHSDSHELTRIAGEIAATGRALIGGGAASAFYLSKA